LNQIVVRGRKALLITAGGAALAFAMWAGYAWRGSFSPAGPATQTTAADAGGLAEQPPAERLTSLRATRPGPAGFPAAEPKEAGGPVSLATAVRANAPPSGDAVIEMVLRPEPPVASTPPVPRPAPAEPSQAASVSTLAMPPAAGPVAPPTARGAAALESGRAALARGDFIAARAFLSSALRHGLAREAEDAIRAELGRLAEALLFSRASNTGDPLVLAYTVAPGDTLNTIAARHRISDDLLARINAIGEPQRLRAGHRLKIVQGPFRAVIDKSDHRMDLLVGDVFIAAYRVGLGVNGGTPTGNWVVSTKVTNPDWTDPVTSRHYPADDPANPIGERWIGLEGVSGEALGKVGFGIHGTIDPASIGQNQSMGCIRMSAEDVARVYDLLVERHSQVVVRP
jgi:LysM repeat protein